VLSFSSRIAGLVVAAGIVFAMPLQASAQSSSPGYFIPPSGGAQSSPAPAHVHHHSHESAPIPSPLGAGDAATAAATAQAQPKLPAIPQLPALPKGTAPPVAVIGVLSVPEVMQKSTAAQGVQQVIQGRRAKLAAEAKADQARWQDEQALIAGQRGKISDASLEAKENDLRNQIAAAQTDFQARDQAIQNSAQSALGQIESTLIAVIRQEAEARGMNLVLHREQVALNVDAFDITNDVAAQLNQLLPSVTVPPSIVTPGMPINTDQSADNGQGQGQ